MLRKPGFVFLLLGVTFLGLFSVWRLRQTKILSFFTKVPLVFETRAHSGFRPVRILIPSKAMNLAVKEAVIRDGVWETFPDAVSHLDSSAYPGEAGNIVIYGHNKNSFFGPIRWLTEGDLIVLVDEQENKHSYKVSQLTEVKPVEIAYVLPKDRELLTLYTCSGPFDTKRFIVVAEPTASLP